MTALRRTALTTAVLTYGLVVLGAVVRATNSGLSCPDWPTCYGHWLPLPSDIAAIPDVGYTYTQVMLEWVHRLLAGFVIGPLILVVAWLCWRRRSADPRHARDAVALVVLLLVQAGLGGVTVLDRNSPWSVALHLCMALLLLAMLLLAAERARPARDASVSTPVLRLWGVAAWLLALATMATAAVVAKTGAAFACPDWPLCGGRVIPALDEPDVLINALHRFCAAALTIAIVVVHVAGRGTGESRLVAHALVIVLVAVGLGALVPVLELPLWVAVLHQAVGVLVFVLLTLVLWRVFAVAAPPPEGRHVRLQGA